MQKAFKPRELKPVTDARPFAFGRRIDETTGDHGYLLRWKVAETYYGWNEWVTSDERQLIAKQLIRARREMRRRIASAASNDETTTHYSAP